MSQNVNVLECRQRFAEEHSGSRDAVVKARVHPLGPPLERVVRARPVGGLPFPVLGPENLMFDLSLRALICDYCWLL